MLSSNWREVVLDVIVVAAGIINAYFWKKLIYSGAYNVTLFSLPLASLFLFAAFFSLSALFAKRGAPGLIAVAAAFAGSFFFIPATSVAISSLIITVLGAVWAYQRIRKEALLAVSFSLSKILRQGLPVFFTAVALLVSVFYLSFTLKDEARTLVPRAIFDISLPALQSSLQGLIPGFRSDATVDQILLEAVKSQLGTDINVSKVSKGQLDQLLAEERAAFEKGLGVKITGKEKAADLLYALANKKLEGLAGPYKQYIPYLSAFGFFLAVKVLTTPLYFISLGIIWLTVQLLLALGVLKRETVSIEVMRITL